MNYTAIVRILSMLGLAKTGVLAIGATVAIFAQEWTQLVAFGVAILAVTVVSASLLLLTPRPRRRATPRDGLAVLILWWLLASLAGAVPFIFDAPAGAILMPFHESVSNLTTTGHVVLAPVGEGGWPVSLVFWRGLLHLEGALASLVTAASIFAALNLGGPGIHNTVLFTIPEGSFFDTMPRVIIAAALALFGLVVTLFIILVLGGVPVARALSDAVSVAATGLVDPGRAGQAPLSPTHGIILFAGLAFSTIGLAVALEAWAGRWRRVAADPEVLTLIFIGAGITGLAVLAGLSVSDAAGWAVSQFSTAGLPLSDPAALRQLPVSVLILPALIGGAALSTAGGIKLARLALLLGRAGEEFSRLGFRDSVVVMGFRGRILPDSAVIGVWVYLVAYVAALTGLTIGFSLAGLGFPPALQSAAGTLSNSGNLVALGGAAHPEFASILSISAMLLGRLEIIAVIPALMPAFWRG